MVTNEIRQIAESLRLLREEPTDESALVAVKKLNGFQSQLQQYAEKLSGTPGWQSFGAAVVYGVGRSAVLELMANHMEGTIVVMDRITLRLKPYKVGSVGPVYDLAVEASRLVRDTTYGQTADVEDEARIRSGDLMFKDIGPAALLNGTRKFWKKVKDLKPKPPKKESFTSNFIGSLAESDAIGKTILQQMGGAGRIAVMIGVKHFSWLPKGVQFKWPNKQKSKGNCVRITLRDDDTYDMEFLNVTGTSAKLVKKYESVYNDQLVDIFESQTGWYLSLGGGRKSATGNKPGPEVDPSRVTKSSAKPSSTEAVFWTVSSIEGTYPTLDAAKKAWVAAGKPKAHGNSVWATEHQGPRTLKTVTLNASMESKVAELRNLLAHN